MPDTVKPYRQGVGIVLLNKDGLVFAGCRADREEEAWQLPQGGMEPGENPIEAAFREIEEELGGGSWEKVEVATQLRARTRYDYPLAAAATERGRRFRGQEHRWVVMRFTGRDTGIDLGKSEGEFRSWRWLPPQEVVGLVAAFKRHGYIAVFMELAVKRLAPGVMSRP